MRKAKADLEQYTDMNKNLQGVIETQTAEKQRLMGELKKYNRGRQKGNILEAEIFRRNKIN